MLYEDSVEVLEALGFEAALGHQEWLEGYHVDDLLALADALFWAQHCPVRWKPQVVGDPFRALFEREAAALMIRTVTRGTPRVVTPSYFTWKPPTDYIQHKFIEFFWEALPEPYRVYKLHAKRHGSEFVFSIEDEGTLLYKMPAWSGCDDATRVKAELTRALITACSRIVDMRYVMESPSKVNTRDYFYYAMLFVDRIWGSAPSEEHTHRILAS